ncbi:MAG: hypothetical protein ACI30N_03385 [Muribaculaceae bacterium]
MTLKHYIAAALLFAAGAAKAQQPADTAAVTDFTEEVTEVILTDKAGDGKEMARPLRFAWGAELNGGVEMSGHDMSTIGIGANFGLEYKWLRFLGVGAEANIMVDNSSRVFPLAVIFRTDFSQRRRLCFLDLRGGIALTYFKNEKESTQGYGSASVGFTLASGRTFASFLSVGYSYIGRDRCMQRGTEHDCRGMSYATIRLGISF